ncbi:MAG: metallophosphoesterase family protein [Chloroflexia bacterium]
MIRILHFADLHLGVENYGRVDPTTGLSSRVRDFLDRLDEVVDWALRERVDVVAFAGDAFRDRHPDPTYQRDFARRIRQLAAAGIAVVLVAGNHDLPGMPVRATSLDIFRALEVENVYVSARTEEVLRLDLGPQRLLQVATFPYPQRSRLLLSDEVRRRPLREQEEFLRAQIAQNLARLAEQVDRDIPAVLVGHLLVQGAELGTEQRMVLGYQPEAMIGAVAHPAYDAVLLGHIHRKQVLRSEFPPVLYAGSLERVDFGDEGQEKGFFTVEIEDGPAGRRPVHYRFIPVKARPFLTISVDARRGEPMERALRAVQEAGERVAGAVVRLQVQVRQEDAGRVDVPALRRALEGALFATVTVEVERPERTVFRAPMEALGPLEALERYWIGRGVPAQRREILSRYARELMGEEALSDG